MARKAKGVVLIEVLIALVLLSLTGTAWIKLINEHLLAVERIEIREAEIQTAGHFLHSLTMLTAEELTRYPSAGNVGNFIYHIETSDRRLFSVTVLDADSRVSLLKTRLYPTLGSNHVVR